MEIDREPSVRPWLPTPVPGAHELSAQGDAAAIRCTAFRLLPQGILCRLTALVVASCPYLIDGSPPALIDRFHPIPGHESDGSVFAIWARSDQNRPITYLSGRRSEDEHGTVRFVTELRIPLAPGAFGADVTLNVRWHPLGPTDHSIVLPKEHLQAAVRDMREFPRKDARLS